MLLQVHDELIFEGPRAEEAALREMLHRIMPASLSLIVPLGIEIKSGKNWADME
jgi:DNA polymerase-1